MQNLSNTSRKLLKRGIRTEAHHYLIRMTLDEDESLLAHNSEYAAIHEAAHGITPEEQRSEIALMDYTRTPPPIYM